MIYLQQPEVFCPKFEAVSCFVECNGEILLLHRQDYKPQGNTWGIPTGKVDSGERLLDAMLREIYEETGLQKEYADLFYFKKIFVKYPDCDFMYYLFHSEFNHQPKIEINPKEHKDFIWVSPKQALKMPLIPDLDACINLYYKK